MDKVEQEQGAVATELLTMAKEINRAGKPWSRDWRITKAEVEEVDQDLVVLRRVV